MVVPGAAVAVIGNLESESLRLLKENFKKRDDAIIRFAKFV